MKLKKLLKIYAKAVKIVSEVGDWRKDWADIYNLIFSKEISYKINKYLDYHDPDSNYKDDVEAFMEAFKAYVITRL